MSFPVGAESLKNKVQSQAYRLVRWQIISVVVLAIIAWLIYGQKNGLSFLAGGLAYSLPNILLVWISFPFVGAKQMHQFLANFFLGETLKLFLCAGLFIFIVKCLPVSLISTVLGFAGAAIVFWFVSMWFYGIVNSEMRKSRSEDE